MSNTDLQTSEAEQLALMKERADKLGVKYHPSIGLEALTEKVNAKLNEQEPPKKELTEAQRLAAEQQALINEASRLVRVRVTNMNPNKREYEGEIFTVSNSVVGTFRKYVHYNVEWHVPNIIYQYLKEKECQVFYDDRGPRGQKVRRGKLIKEFAIEVLPQLSQSELKDLAQRQAMANSVG